MKPTKMTRQALLLATCLFLGAPATAEAAHCRLGQIYRVHMHRCVGASSRAAREVRHYRHRHRFAALAPRRHHAKPANDPRDPIEDRVTEPKPTVTTTPAKPVESTTPRSEAPLPNPFGKSVMGHVGGAANAWAPR